MAMGPSFSFEIEAVPPFRLDLTVWALRRRPGNIIDRWDGKTYRRMLVMQGFPLNVSVFQHSTSDATLHVSIDGAEPMEQLKSAIAGVIETMLGIKTDCTNFYMSAAQNGELCSLSNRFRGLKPPRFPSVFEALVNGIACQQLSLDFGITLLNRLTEAAGAFTTIKAGVVHAFPDPHDTGGLTGDDLRAMGFSRQKARALLDLAKAITDGEIRFEEIAELDNEKISEVLQGLRGVGRWTAEYVMLRGLGRIDVFPGDDVGARKKLQNWLHLTGPLSYDEVKKVTGRWYPYAGFVYFHLLLTDLAAKGYISDV
jgi:DNA-3-methyladenine glycosylase II